jgi:hypothetical protein
MGQYFCLANLDKREYVCPWCIGSGAKLWEWAANTSGAVGTILLRKSDEGGGGDYYGYQRGNSEGGPITPPLSRIVGRWAGDRIALVGDYDSSKLWDELPRWRNISEQVVMEWNDFIELPEKKLEFRPDCKHA